MQPLAALAGGFIAPPGLLPAYARSELLTCAGMNSGWLPDCMLPSATSASLAAGRLCGALRPDKGSPAGSLGTADPARSLRGDKAHPDARSFVARYRQYDRLFPRRCTHLVLPCTVLLFAFRPCYAIL